MLVDMLGYEVAAGDFVCSQYGGFNELGIFEVTRTTGKMLKLRHYKAKNELKDLRYPGNVIKLTEEQTKAFLFKIIKG